MHFKTFCLAAAITLASGAASAATLTVSGGGELLGATGVTVGGNLYDVTFDDGTCADVFGTCETSSFDFSTSGDATAAAQALLDQVFTGQFDTNPELTFGCGSLNQCLAVIPYLVDLSAQFPLITVAARNRNGANDDETTPSLLNLDFNLGGTNSQGADNNFVFARFALAPVPVPAAMPLMLLALGGLGLAARKRRAD